MIVLIDSREQKPILFPKDELIEGCETVTLGVGDYAVRLTDGSVPPLRFERKSLGDLFSTMTAGHKRFKRELLRAKEANLKLILLVERGLSEVAKGTTHTSYPGATCLKKVFTLWVKYDLLPVFCKDRREAQRFMRETFTALGRNYVRA